MSMDGVTWSKDLAPKVGGFDLELEKIRRNYFFPFSKDLKKLSLTLSLFLFLSQTLTADSFSPTDSVSLYLRHKHKIYQTHTRLAAVVVLVIGLSSLLSISRIVRLAWLLFLYLPIWPKLINTLYLVLSLTLKNIHTIYTFTNTKQLLLSPSLCCSKYLPPSLSSFSFVSHGPSYKTVWPDWATFEVTWRHILLQN